MAAKELIDEKQFKQEKVELEKRIAGLEEEREDTKKRAENWYDTVSRVFDLAVHGRERFLNGDIVTKKEMLADFGQNPILLNGELTLTPHPWFVPIENDYKKILR